MKKENQKILLYYFFKCFLFYFYLKFIDRLLFKGKILPSKSHLVEIGTVDHVKGSIAVPHSLRLPAAVWMADARGRTSSVVSATALWVDEECCGRFRNYFARFTPATRLELQLKKRDISSLLHHFIIRGRQPF